MQADTAVASTICGWTKLFHPRGPQVTLPLPADAVAAFASVGAALDAGWLVTAPGLEDGEEKESIAYVLRGAFERDGEVTPYVLLYAANDALTWSILKVYLNKREDIEAFEYASGMKLDSIPDYIGDNKPQRGAAAKTDRFIVKSTKPFGVVYKKNPKHDDTEAGKMKPARLFVRWENQKPAAQSQQQNGAVHDLKWLKRALDNSGKQMVEAGLCGSANDLIAFVRDTLDDTLSLDVTTWPASAVEHATDAVKKFAAQQRAAIAAGKQEQPAYSPEEDDDKNIPF
jgi:hypothetical protein